MTKHELAFPRLGLSFEIKSIAFSIGNFHVYWYGLIVMIGMAAAVIYIMRHAKSFDVSPDVLESAIVWSILGGVIGARLYYIAFSWDEVHSLWDAINIRSGGIAIYGGLIGGLFALVMVAKLKRVSLLPLLDLGASGVLVGQAVGRWGNFINMEAFGTNTELPWGMTSLPIERTLVLLQKRGVLVDPNLPVHPCFLYESIWCLIGFFVLMIYAKHRRFDGEILLIYLGWYSLGRFFIEGLRIDSLMCCGFRVSQMLSLVLAVFSLVTWRVARGKVAGQRA